MDDTDQNSRFDALERAQRSDEAAHLARLTTPARSAASKAQGLAISLFAEREQLSDEFERIEQIRKRGEIAHWRNVVDAMRKRGELEEARQLNAQLTELQSSEAVAIMGSELDDFDALDEAAKSHWLRERILRNRANDFAAAEKLPMLEADQSRQRELFTDRCTEFNALLSPLLSAARAVNSPNVNAIAALFKVTRMWVFNWSVVPSDGVIQAGRDALDDLIDRLPLSDSPVEPNQNDEALPKVRLRELEKHDRQAWQMSLLHGMTQSKVAEALNREHFTEYNQGQVSKMIARAKSHADASGLSDMIPDSPRLPLRIVDPAKLGLGARTDGRRPQNGRSSDAEES